MKEGIGLLAFVAITVAAAAFAQQPSGVKPQQLPPDVRTRLEQLNSLAKEPTSAAKLTPALRADLEQLNSLEKERTSAAKLTPEQQKMFEQRAEQLRLKMKSDVLAEPTGPEGGVSTWDCLGACDLEYDQCKNNAGDSWFRGYLCDLDAVSCIAKCIKKKLP
jgi:hypothetical protein